MGFGAVWKCRDGGTASGQMELKNGRLMHTPAGQVNGIGLPRLPEMRDGWRDRDGREKEGAWESGSGGRMGKEIEK